MEEARELRRMAAEAKQLAELLPDTRAIAQLHAHAEILEETAVALESYCAAHTMIGMHASLSCGVPATSTAASFGPARTIQALWSR